MKNVIENLERYYKYFIDQPNNHGFFLGLAEYIKYIAEMPEMGKIIKLLNKERANADKELNKYEIKALLEIKEINNKLWEKIEKTKIAQKDRENLKRIRKGWEDYEEGKIGTSESNVEYLCGLLVKFIRYLNEHNYKNIVNDFIKTNKQEPNLITEYTCFKNINLYYKAEEKYEEKEKIELWRAWEKLFLVYEVIFNREEFLERYKKNRWTYLNLQGIITEMKKIINASISDPVWFKKDNYINDATRIHNYLIQELSKKRAEKPTKEEKINAKAEYKNEILYFRGKEINFRNKQNQKDLLTTLFEDPKKNWYYDEIQEKWDDQWEDVKETNPKAKDYWKKFYNAGNDINTAVAIEAQVKDFIIKNTKEIRINPQYV